MPDLSDTVAKCRMGTAKNFTLLLLLYHTQAKALGMTQEELAEALNVSLEHLSKMERGKRKPSIDLIVAMACYFHVSTDYLLMGKDHDMEESRTKLLSVVMQLTEIAKSL